MTLLRFLSGVIGGCTCIVVMMLLQQLTGCTRGLVLIPIGILFGGAVAALVAPMREELSDTEDDS